MPQLGYWNIRGLAQPVRLLLNYVGQEFDDVYYEQGEAPEYGREQWTKVKYTLGLPFPNLPYYIDGDIKITQSNAILRYIADKHNMRGTSDKEKANVDMMLEVAMDFRNGVVRMVYNPEYEKMVAEYKTKTLPGLLESYEKRLSDNKWFAGDNVTVADFPMYELLDQHRLMISSDCLKKYTKITEFMKRFEELPNIKKYMATKRFIQRPVNNKAAQFK